jgi:diguanylate cyclase (GGDEF)-like protein
MDIIKHKDAGFILSLVLVFVTALSPIPTHIDDLLFDQLPPVESDTGALPILIDIDDKSLQALGRWPWPRDVHAEMINTLIDANAKTLGYNIAFIDPDLEHPENDTALKEAMEQHGRIVLPVLSESGKTLFPFRSETLPEGSLLGHVEVDVSNDGHVRSAFLKGGIDSPRWPAYGLAMYQMHTGDFGYEPGTRAPVRELGINQKWSRDQEVMMPPSSVSGQFKHYSFIDVLEKKIDFSPLSGAPVFVGIQAAGLEPRFLLPGNERPYMVSGTTLHATLFYALSHKTLLTPILPIWGTCYAILLTALLYASLIWLQHNKALRFLFGCVTLAGLTLPFFALTQGYWLSLGAAIIGITAVLALYLGALISRFSARHRSDSVTALANKRMWEETLILEWEQAVRKKTPLSLIMIEMDHFKRFYDTFGPERANWVQARVAQILLHHQRRTRDLCARTGNAQFGVLLPVTTNSVAASLAEKIRADIQALHIEHVKSSQVVTVSAAVMTWHQTEQSDQLLTLSEWLKMGFNRLDQKPADQINQVINLDEAQEAKPAPTRTSPL